MKRLIFLIALIVFCSSVYASDINILTYKEEYRQLETFQAEIIFDKEPLNDLTSLNFELIKENKIGVLLFLEKLSNKRYFVYFDIPNLDNGNYTLRVKDVNIIKNGVLNKISGEKSINIKDY